jgi:hypothetical protein
MRLAQVQQRNPALVEKDHAWAVAFWSAVGYGRDSRMERFVHDLECSRVSAEAEKDRT